MFCVFVTACRYTCVLSAFLPYLIARFAFVSRKFVHFPVNVVFLLYIGWTFLKSNSI